MKAFKLLLLTFLLGGSAAFAQTQFNDFIPVGPVPIDYKIADGRLFSELSMDEKNNGLVINLLPNELEHKSISMMDKKGKTSFSPIELSVSKNKYIVKTDYIKYTTLPVRKDSETGEIIGLARVGVGVRIEATMIAKKSNVMVTDLIALGTAVVTKGLSGHITLSIMGIESEEVTSGFPANAEISATSIATALQTLVLVKQAQYDPDTHLTPQVLEIKYNEEYKANVSNLMDLSMPILLPNRGEPCVVIK